MATKTISLSEDAYERLKAEKREGESFSDVVRRITGTVDVMEYFGALDADVADDLEDAVDEARERNRRRRADRARELFESDP